MAAEQVRAEPTNPEPAPWRITDADLPRLFQLTDRFAMEAQRRSLRSVRNHILCLIGASLAQLPISLHDELAQWLDFALREPPDLDWMNVWRVGLVAFVALGLATRTCPGSRRAPWPSSPIGCDSKFRSPPTTSLRAGFDRLGANGILNRLTAVLG